MSKLSKYDVGKLKRHARVIVNGRAGTVIEPHEPSWIDHKTRAFMQILQGADIGFDDEPRPIGTYVHVEQIELVEP